MDLRCEAKLHGVVVRPGVVEVKCSSRFCGAGPGVTVLHRFDAVTAELVETVQFKNPERRQGDAPDQHPAAVRSA